MMYYVNQVQCYVLCAIISLNTKFKKKNTYLIQYDVECDVKCKILKYLPNEFHTSKLRMVSIHRLWQQKPMSTIIMILLMRRNIRYFTQFFRVKTRNFHLHENLLIGAIYKRRCGTCVKNNAPISTWNIVSSRTSFLD